MASARSLKLAASSPANNGSFASLISSSRRTIWLDGRIVDFRFRWHSPVPINPKSRKPLTGAGKQEDPGS
jgi:hypothetical protein